MMSLQTAGGRKRWLRTIATTSLLSVTALLTGCFDSDSNSNSGQSASAPLFPEDGDRQAEIRRTTNGVPHIKADDLSSASYGLGYAQAQDNLCVLADSFVKARSERAKYFGPGGPKKPNIISDFSLKARGVLSGAASEIKTLSEESQAMLTGFTAGYNQYVAETDPADYPAECRGGPWVTEITPANLLAYYKVVGQNASGEVLSAPVYLAGPDGKTPKTKPVMAASSLDLDLDQINEGAARIAHNAPEPTDLSMGSNAWGIGKDMTESGRGALLANPHFPYTGALRLYQAQMKVDGYLNINGAGLLGTAIPLINYNKNLGWSHTVTTSRRFTLYELTLKDGDIMTYMKDGEEKPITKKTFEIQVDNGTETPTVLKRDFYFSEYGPMVSANVATDPDGPTGPKPGGLPSWGGLNQDDITVAYTYRDANADTGELLDTWLGMSRANNLSEFKDVFREQCGTTLWTNTIYSDKEGNAFYMDSSSVPHLSEAALAVVDLKRRAAPDSYGALFDKGLTLLDGSTSRDDWIPGDCGNGLVPYAEKPKLQRTDFVQNSNDSYWSTNPDQFLTGYSPLFGAENAPIGPRTKIGLTMVQNPMEKGFASKAPAGQDGKFSAKDLIETIYNDRSWYAHQYLGELRNRCTTIDTTQVNLESGGTRPVDSGCDALKNWDGTYSVDSKGAHVFRVFMANYAADDKPPEDLTIDFNPLDPVNTPKNPDETNAGTPSDPMLMALAKGLESLDKANIAYNAKLGDVQYYQPTGDAKPGGTAVKQSPRIPWHGGHGGIDGAFNAIEVLADSVPAVEEGTLIPRRDPDQIPDTAGLSDINGINNPGAGWPIERGTSWHFGLEFTDNGPEAYGLVSYSQSNDSMSDFFTDQSKRYSNKNYRELAFTEDEIEANLLPQGTKTISE